MSDFQIVTSSLRSLGIGVAVENYGLYQIAKIDGKNISGYFVNTNHNSLEDKVMRYEKALIEIVNHSDKSYQGEIAKNILEG